MWYTAETQIGAESLGDSLTVGNIGIADTTFMQYTLASLRPNIRARLGPKVDALTVIIQISIIMAPLMQPEFIRLLQAIHAIAQRYILKIGSAVRAILLERIGVPFSFGAQVAIQ